MIIGIFSRKHTLTTQRYASKSLLLGVALILLTIFVFVRPADASTPETSDKYAGKKTLSATTASDSETEMVVRTAVAENALKTTKEISRLAVKISSQQEEIKALRKQIENLEKPGDINTITIVLTCVSVLITILGVAFAILSIFGYTNIREEATRSAKTAAKETVEKITKDELPAETEKNIIALMEDKRFDKVIQNAVENVMYRGISIANEASENGDTN
ncbi:hypothetical protein [Pseudomonas syringae group genomosp. 7]|uniref:hypothetical protein n=1 Tax=Pseudomonas syringae group genomosp. 7 TaxID=251699 RepID=UPI000A565D12|nr:hypothetical protein [Pseudomonas syringae group genomosp. 7]UNB64171.1 hypothetical protein MME54_05095 [Pseudomonas syringae pv. helianthi]